MEELTAEASRLVSEGVRELILVAQETTLYGTDLYGKKSLHVIRECLEMGISPRCHLEDVTRADIYGYVIPFCLELMKLKDEYGIPIKVRACDTMGYGVNYPGSVIPRSVPGIIYGIRNHSGVPSELIEWHGHNDFYKAVSNSTTAWLYGASGVNTSLFGIGERTGNTPLEAMVFEYAQIRGTLDGMDTKVITELAEYYEKEIGYKIPPRTPFVGSNFNVTRAGIHADGILKNEEIYNIFDTQKFLNRPVEVAVSNTSGAAGIAHWIDTHYHLHGHFRKNFFPALRTADGFLAVEGLELADDGFLVLFFFFRFHIGKGGCMAGAAVFAGLSALRTGAGMVKILTAEENRKILQIRLPEAMQNQPDSVEPVPGRAVWP